MNKISEFIKGKDFSLVVGMVIGTIFYCFAVVFLIDLGSFFTTGITGIAQIITSIIANFTGFEIIGLKSILIAVFNVPLFLVAWKGISKRFAIVSLLSVGLQVILVALFEYMFSRGFNPFSAFAKVEGEANVGRMLCLSIMGGLLTGIGEGVSLRYGGSTGGMDVVSQYVSLSKHKSFTKVTLTLDLTVILCSALFGSIEVAVYTIIRLIISVLVIDKIYTAYNYSKIVIVTDERQRMKDALVENLHHGLTIYQAVGGYTNKPKYVIEVICWAFETREYLRLAKKIDPKCFVSTVGVKSVEGNFRINVIA